MRELTTWDNYAWTLNGCENSMIMTELSQEMAVWASNGEVEETQRLLDFIENYFFEGDNGVTSIIYTDFLVTIIEIKDKEIRETIKRMMKPETAKHCKQLFKFYREAN
tara:strand:- start:361 stop:684 length:324 start_codon:yes stop_codon:yes gene_type:complete